MAVSRGYLTKDFVAVREAPDANPDIVSSSVSILADDGGGEEEEEEENDEVL